MRGCRTASQQDQPPADNAAIEVFASATGETQDAALYPLRGTFDTTSSFSVGAAGDPEIRVIDPALCAKGCMFAYQFVVSASPLDLMASPIVTDSMLLEEDGMNVGLSHGIAFEGPAANADIAAFASRPWAIALQLDYYFAADSTECTDVEGNAAARFVYSVVMTPE